MDVLLVAALLAIGIPTLIVVSFPLHAVLVLRRSRRHRADGPTESICILVPVRGLDEGTSHALRQLVAQRTDGPLEWLFCVEDEADPALPALRDAAAADPERIRVLITGSCGTRLGKMHNLIEGLRAARGAWLVMVDSDTILPHARYLHEFVAPLRTESVGLVTCFPAYRNASSVPGALLTGAINHDLLGYFALQSIWGGLHLANGSCMAIRREVLERIGGFGPQSASLLMDVILARRVQEADYEVRLHHEPVEVPCRTVTFRVWWNQAHRWQVGMARVLSGPFYAWHCWLRSVFPVALLMLPFVTGPLATVAMVAVATRVAVVVIMSQAFIRDRRQLIYLWLLPALEVVTAVGCWYALLYRRVEWRGRRYDVLRGGVTRRLA